MPITERDDIVVRAARHAAALELAATVFAMCDRAADGFPAPVDRVLIHFDPTAGDDDGIAGDGHPVVAVDLRDADGNFIDPPRSMQPDLDDARDAVALSGVYDGLSFAEMMEWQWELLRPHGPAVSAFIELDNVTKTSPVVDISGSLSQLADDDLDWMADDGWASSATLEEVCYDHPDLARFLAIASELEETYRICVNGWEADAWLDAHRAAAPKTGPDRVAHTYPRATGADPLHRKRMIASLVARTGVSKRQAANWLDRPDGRPSEVAAMLRSGDAVTVPLPTDEGVHVITLSAAERMTDPTKGDEDRWIRGPATVTLTISRDRGIGMAIVPATT